MAFWQIQSQATGSYRLVRAIFCDPAMTCCKGMFRWWRAGGKAVIEPDASSASYPFAVAAATGSTITVPHLNEKSLQGDYGFVDVLAQMGCTVAKHNEWTKVTGQTAKSRLLLSVVVAFAGARRYRYMTVYVDWICDVQTGPEKLKGIDVDMHHISDTVMTLAALAPLAEGPTTIRNVANIRIKETDRLVAIVNELRRLGQDIEHGEDWIKITPAPASLRATHA